MHDGDTTPNLSEENLALRPGVAITVSQPNPQGGGARDPRVLLNETAHRVDGQALSALDRRQTYDTYDGQNQGTGTDWYALEFPGPVVINSIEMTMGYPHYDGGWWTSLAVEVGRGEKDAWTPVERLEVSPPYPLEDSPTGRLPFETFTLTFESVCIRTVRIIGRPGGCAQLTSLARLAVYHRDLSRWNPLTASSSPKPRVFRLISPSIVFDLSTNFAEVTGVGFGIPLMEYYLDPPRYEKFWQSIERNYAGEPDFVFLMGEHVGWYTWNHIVAPDDGPHSPTATVAHVQSIFHNVLARAVAPIVIAGEVVAAMSTGLVLVKDRFDESWHRCNAEQLGIPWETYRAGLDRTPRMTWRQVEATAELLSLIANTIATLTHHLELAMQETDQRRVRRKEIVRRAIDYMERHLEDRVTVANTARALGLTPPYFSTLFTQETGRHPRDFLVNLRIERAKEYLAHTRLSVVEVADVLGYSSPSHFSRLFKAHVGVPPSQYARTP